MASPLRVCPQQSCVRGRPAHAAVSRPVRHNVRLTPNPFTAPGRRNTVVCNGLFGLGLPEIAVIAGVAAVIWGPSKLPELGKGLGQTLKSFQQAAKEFETELKAASEDDTAKAGEQPKAAAGEQPKAAAAAEQPKADTAEKPKA